MTYVCFLFVLYWFAPFLKFGPLPSENLRCAPELLSIAHEIYNSFDEGFEVRSVVLDISKAFDKV